MSSTSFRPPPPKPTRLNHVALLSLGVLALVTVIAVLSVTASHARAPAADSTAVAPRVFVAQRPSYPQDSQNLSVSRPAISPQSPRPVSRPPHAWSSALRVQSVIGDTVPRATSSPYVLLSGAVISASLLTEIHSTLPGLVVAQVERDVYDTPTLRWVLIPRGSRLVGHYDSKVAQGEDALSVVWTRLIFPNGRSLALPDLESADALGTAGLRGAVNSHLAHAYLDAGLLSLVGAGAQLSQAPASVPFGVASPGQVIAGSLGQQVTEQSLEVVRNDARTTPVITVRGGASFLVMVSRDVMFDRPY
jgi:type IV secretory pathway VirB10-like protein